MQSSSIDFNSQENRNIDLLQQFSWDLNIDGTVHSADNNGVIIAQSWDKERRVQSAL